MKLRFNITFKAGTRTVAVVEGKPISEEASAMTVAQITEQVLDTEQFLEKLTGLRVHINTAQVS